MGTVVIIGAGAGLGEALAKRFAAGGYDIGLIARSSERLEALSRRLLGTGAQVVTAAADAGDSMALSAAIDTIAAKLGAPEIAICNAARLEPGGALDTSTDTLAADLKVNLLGAHAMARQVAPAMLARGTGAILFTGGGLALEPYPDWTSLALGKAALRNLSFSLFKELAPQGVHVAVIAVCGIVAQGGPFDPDRIAEEYWRIATNPMGLEDRELIFQPEGTDPFYNDPTRIHAATTRAPMHVIGGSDAHSR